MSKNRATGRGRRTSYLDRTWLNRWTVLTLAPIHAPTVDELRSKMVDFMTAEPTHQLCCTLEEGGKRWRPVAPGDRLRHVQGTIVHGGPFYLDEPWEYLDQHRPDGASTAPFKIMVGPDSITFYFSHACGDAMVFSPFSVLMALGDVEGLRALKADAGLAVATKILLKEAGSHWREWWNHLRSVGGPALAGAEGTPARQASHPPTTASTGMSLSPDAFDAFKAWRKERFPEVATTALMASASYLALAAEGIALNPNGFYTLVDLRRHLPKEQSLRPGNLAKGVFIPAEMVDPAAVGAGLKQLVSTSRAVPALFSGALAVALRRPVAAPEAAGSGPVTMTFNSMMRNPGIESIPWVKPAEARYLTTSYPVAADGISVSACAVAGAVLFSAAFDPHQIDTRAVARALERLHDMPSLLEPQLSEVASESPEETIEWIHAPAVLNGSSSHPTDFAH